MAIEIESDGSIIISACRVELYALKVTYGAVDDTGVRPTAGQFYCLGGFSKSVTDLAHLVTIIHGHESVKYLLLSPSWERFKLCFADSKNGVILLQH